MSKFLTVYVDASYPVWQVKNQFKIELSSLAFDKYKISKDVKYPSWLV